MYSSPAHELTRKLNKIKPDEQDKILLNDKQIEDLSDTEKCFAVEELKNDEVIETLKHLANTTPNFTFREIDMFDEYLGGDSHMDIANRYGLHKERVRQIISNCVHKIKMYHNDNYRKEYLENHPNCHYNYKKS